MTFTRRVDTELIEVDHINELQEAIETLQSGVANVLDYGAVGDGVTDDTAAIQDAINSGAGTVLFPNPTSYYRVTAAIVPISNQRLLGTTGLQYVHSSSNTATRSRIGGASTYNGPIIKATSVTGVTLDGLTITGSGNAAHTANIGVDITSANWWTIKNCMFNNFAAEAIKWRSGVALRLYDCFTTNCYLNRSGHADYVGVIDLNGSDPYVVNNEFGASCSSVGDGYIAACIVRSAAGMYVNNVFEISEVGLVIDDSGDEFQNVFLGNRADLNYGHGFVVQFNENQFIGNRSYRNGRSAHDTYDGFLVSGANNQFIGNSVFVRSVDMGVLAMRYGFNDSSSTTDPTSNVYVGNKVSSGLASGSYNVTDGNNQVIDFTTRPAYTPTNVATDRAFDADSTTTAELADVLGTLIADLQTQGILT